MTVSNDKDQYAPLITAGIGLINEPFANELFNLKAGIATKIPIGGGVFSVRASSDFEVYPLRSLKINSGISVHGQYAYGKQLEQLSFLKSNNLSLEANIGASVDLDVLAKLKSEVFAILRFDGILGNGLYGEGTTTFSLGVRIKVNQGSDSFFNFHR